MNELVENPTRQMQEAGRNAGEYQTFTKPLGETGKKFQSIVNSHPLWRIPFTFVRTPINILKYAGERTVLATLSKEVRNSLKGKNGKAAQSEQAARIVAGSSISYMAYEMAKNGDITGAGPSDPQERALLYMSGWQPNSVRVGDMYYSYGRLEPLGMLMGVVASGAEISNEWDEIESQELPALFVGSISKNLISKS